MRKWSDSSKDQRFFVARRRMLSMAKHAVQQEELDGCFANRLEKQHHLVLKIVMTQIGLGLEEIDEEFLERS